MIEYITLINLLKILPDDIIRENIIPYTLQIQPRHLCDDIKSFFLVKNCLYELYYNRWKHTFYYEDNADINWLCNDMLGFFNDNIATIHGYTINHLKKWKRLFIFHDKSDLVIIDFLNKYRDRNCFKEVNVLIGILTHIEREQFIELINV